MNRRLPALPKSPLNCRAFLRRPLTHVPTVAALALFSAGQTARAGNDAYSTNASSGKFSSSFTDGTSTPAAGGTAAPASNDALFFGTGTTTTVSNDLSGYTFAGITFNAGASAFTITGNTFTLSAGITNLGANQETFSNTGGLSVSASSETFTVNSGGGGVTVTNGIANTVAGGQTLTVNGPNGLLTLGGYILENNGASAVTDTITGNGNVTISGAVTNGSGTGSLAYSGTGVLTLGGANIYSGATTVSNGTVVLASTGSSSSTGATTVNSGGTYNVLGTLSGATAITVNAAGTFTEQNSATGLGSGVIGAAGSSLTVNGGVAVLDGINTYTGATAVTGASLASTGFLLLDFGSTASTSANNIISASSPLTLGFGGLEILGSTANNATNSQTFASTTFTTLTSSTVSLIQGSGTGTTLNLNLGTLTRGAGAATDFTLPTTGTITTTSTTASSNGILVSAATGGVAYATANGETTWATNTGGTIGALSTYATGNAAYATAASNIDVGAGGNGTTDAPAAAFTVNTLRFNASGLTLTAPAGVNTVSTGGILVTSGSSGTITGGNLEAGAGRELVIINNAGTLNIGSVIQDNAAGSSVLTLTGGLYGTTELLNVNSFSGQTNLLGGTLDLANSLALQNSVLQISTSATLAFDQSVASNAFTLIGLTGAGNIALVNNTAAPVALTLNIATSSAYTYTGVLSGTGATLTKTGAGTETLGAANTYTGVTTINGGILQLGNGFAGKILNTSGVVTAAGASLGFNGGNSGASESGLVGGVISGTGGITDSQGNQNAYLILDKANTYTGPTTMTARGALQSNVAAAYDASGNMVSSGFGVNSALVLGGLGLNAGVTVVLNSNSQLGSLSTNGATVAASAGNGIILNSFNLIVGGDNTSTTFNAQISGGAIPNSATNATRSIGGNLTKIGTGTQILGGNNLYTGSTTITGGTLSIATIANGGFATTGTVASGSNQLTLASATGAVAGQNIQGAVLGVGAEVISSVSGNVVTLNGNASAAAASTPVAFGTANGLGISTNAASNLVLDGGTLQYTGAAAGTDRLFTVGSTEAAGATGTLDASGTGALSFTNTGAIAYGTTGQARTLGLTGTSTAANTLAALIGNNGTGQVSVAKSGVGSWTLTNANTYSGGTTVSAGTLLYNGSLTPAVAGSSVVTVGSTATPAVAAKLGGTGILTVTSVTVNSNGTLSPGLTAGATTGTLTLNTTAGLTINGTLAIGIAGTGSTSLATNGSLTLGSGSILIVTGAANGTSDYDVANYPNPTAESGKFASMTVPTGYQINYAGTTFSLMGGMDIELDPIPEPSTWQACGLLLLGGVAWQFRRRSLPE